MKPQEMTTHPAIAPMVTSGVFLCRKLPPPKMPMRRRGDRQGRDQRHQPEPQLFELLDRHQTLSPSGPTTAAGRGRPTVMCLKVAVDADHDGQPDRCLRRRDGEPIQRTGSAPPRRPPPRPAAAATRRYRQPAEATRLMFTALAAVPSDQHAHRVEPRKDPVEPIQNTMAEREQVRLQLRHNRRMLISVSLFLGPAARSRWPRARPPAAAPPRSRRAGCRCPAARATRPSSGPRS